MKAWRCSCSIDDELKPKEECELYKYATDPDALSSQKILIAEGFELCEKCDMAEYELIPEADYVRQQAALAAAEELLAEIAAKYSSGHMYITHVIGQGAERIRDQIRGGQRD